MVVINQRLIIEMRAINVTEMYWWEMRLWWPEVVIKIDQQNTYIISDAAFIIDRAKSKQKSTFVCLHLEFAILSIISLCNKPIILV